MITPALLSFVPGIHANHVIEYLGAFAQKVETIKNSSGLGL